MPTAPEARAGVAAGLVAAPLLYRSGGGTSDPLSPDGLRNIDAYWRAANYLAIGQIYLQDSPLLERPLELRDIKPRLLGHWGLTPGLNLLYVHLNRLI